MQCACVVLAFGLATLLAACGSSNPAPSSSSTAELSAHDRTSLTNIATCVAQMDASTKAADRILLALEDGTWARKSQLVGAAMQVQAADAIVALGEVLQSSLGAASPATAADIRALEGGPLASSITAALAYLNAADRATDVMMGAQGPTARDWQVARRHARRLRAKRDDYVAARQSLESDFAAVLGRYGLHD